MNKIFYTLIFCFIFFVLLGSCKSTPEVKQELPEPVTTIEKIEKKEVEPIEVKPVQETKNVEIPVKDHLDEVIEEFNGITITKRDKEIAKSEIEEVVKKLNIITTEHNYSAWLMHISDSYKQKYSGKDVLKKVSENLPGALKGIKLHSLADYFKYVFVPARGDARVDDIQYLSPTVVNVLKKDKTKPYILYKLENIDGKWKLVP